MAEIIGLTVDSVDSGPPWRRLKIEGESTSIEDGHGQSFPGPLSRPDTQSRSVKHHRSLQTRLPNIPASTMSNHSRQIKHEQSHINVRVNKTQVFGASSFGAVLPMLGRPMLISPSTPTSSSTTPDCNTRAYIVATTLGLCNVRIVHRFLSPAWFD